MLSRSIRVLVVEEDIEVADSLAAHLRRHGYEADRAESGTAALRGYHRADLVLLNPELSDLHGLEVCRVIRDACDVPIIMVSSRDNELDRILALQAGADDYLAEPYGRLELVARMEAVLRRARPRPPLDEIMSFGRLRIDVSTREVRVDGRRVNLTRKEFDLLCLLASRPGTVVPRRQIMCDVWDDDWSNSSRTIDTHVSSLRNKLGVGSWIGTVRGVGFRFDANYPGDDPYDDVFPSQRTASRPATMDRRG